MPGSGQPGAEQVLALGKGFWISPGLHTRSEGAQEASSTALAMQMSVLCAKQATALSSLPGELEIRGTGNQENWKRLSLLRVLSKTELC